MYNMDIMRQYACLVVNQIMVYRVLQRYFDYVDIMYLQ